MEPRTRVIVGDLVSALSPAVIVLVVMVVGGSSTTDAARIPLAVFVFSLLIIWIRRRDIDKDDPRPRGQ